MPQIVAAGVPAAAEFARRMPQSSFYDEPKLLSPVDFEYRGKRILLVEDRIKTGTTIEYAKKLLDGAAVVKTFAVNGNADYALFITGRASRFLWLL